MVSSLLGIWNFVIKNIQLAERKEGEATQTKEKQESQRCRGQLRTCTDIQGICPD